LLLMNWLILMMVLGDPGWGIVEAKAGNVYAADVIRNVVWKVDASGRASQWCGWRGFRRGSRNHSGYRLPCPEFKDGR
jgi:hypothetical protein